MKSRTRVLAVIVAACGIAAAAGPAFADNHVTVTPTVVPTITVG